MGRVVAERTRRLRRRRLLLVSVAVAIVTGAAALALVAVEVGGMGERIPRGVRVDGVPIGGLSPRDAERRLEAHAQVRLSRPLTLSGPVRTIITSGASLGADARVAEAVAAANAGRVSLVRHLLGARADRNIVLRFDFPPAILADVAERLGERSATDASVIVDADGVRVGAARPGRAIDRARLEKELSTMPPRVDVATVETAPRVTTAAARVSAQRARRLVAKPRTILVGSERHTLEPTELRAALVVQRLDSGFEIGFDPGRLRRFLPPATDARDAKLVVDGARVRVVPSRLGHTIDATAAAFALAETSRTTVRARLAQLRPRVTTSDVAVLRIREQVSTFTTHYPPGQPRVVNIHKAASVIDGTILRPGATFSMNAVLGERTIQKGYLPAPQIVGSSFADSVGGGISQVATTLYNGAFFAGLELIEHQPHSLYIDRYPPGREATISWGGPELIFSNNWPAAVLIDLNTTETSVTVRFFSSRLGRRIETETFAPYGHGGGGFTVEYTRRVYRGSRLVRNERYRVRYSVASVPGGTGGP